MFGKAKRCVTTNSSCRTSPGDLEIPPAVNQCTGIAVQCPMSPLHAFSRVGILFAVLAGTIATSATAQPERWSVEEWRGDLAYLHERIQTAHKNPYHATSKETIDAAVASLHEAIPTLTDFQISFAMQKIVASIGDGHSWLRYTANDLATYFPILSWIFDDGLYITDAMQDSERLVGARVISVEGHSVDSLMDAFEPYMNRDNDMSKLNHLPFMLRVPQALHALGISTNPMSATYQLVDRSGQPFEYTFTGIPAAEFNAWRETIEPPEGAPLYRTRFDDRYWFTELEGKNALYMQFSTVQHREDKHFSMFAREVTDYIDAHDIGCLIIDVRMNGGGDGSIVNHFIRHIGKHETINQDGHLYVINGRNTFSAALMFTIRMERRTKALIVGEPGAGRPNSYSESGPYELPHSGLNGSLSALFHEEGEPDDDRPWVDVDIPAVVTYDDYRANRDPFLDAVLAHWEQVQADEKPRRKKRKNR